MNRYLVTIARLTKLAASLKETSFKPIDNYHWAMFIRNDQLGTDIQYGIFTVGKDFVDFLLSGDFDSTIGGVRDIPKYIKGKILTMQDVPDNRANLNTINQNFDIAKKGNEKQVLELASSGREKTQLYGDFDNRKNNDSFHDKLYFFYNNYLTKNNPQEPT